MKRTLQRSAIATQPYLVWNAFIDLIATEDYGSLSPLQRRAHLVFWYESEVQNGGHYQYFENRGTDLVEETLAALSALELFCHAKLLGNAVTVWRAKSRIVARTAEEFVAGALEGEFDAHDSAFHECRPTVIEMFEKHLAKNQAEYIELV